MSDQYVFSPANDDRGEEALIQVSDVSLGYPAHGGGAAFAALEGVIFGVSEGSVTALLGESGSGKSTLARFIAGRGLASADRGSRLKALSGDVRVGDVSLAGLNRKKAASFASEIGYLEQDGGAKLSPDLTVADILMQPVAEKFKRFDREFYTNRITSLLGEVSLPLEMLSSLPFQLSKGQRQRIAVIRPLVLQPKILVLDEPTMGIDPNSRPQVIDLLERYHREQGATMIIVSHDIALLERLVDDVNILQDGNIVGRGAINDIFSDAQHEYVQRLAVALRSAAYDEAYDG